MTTTYHHGDLPDALRQATAELVAERGPTGFSLREVARRAGVSHAAPAHHFGDSRGLLTSVATEGFRTLNDEFVRVTSGIDDPVERMTRMGKAYVHVALDYPGHFGVMCNSELLHEDDPDLVEASVLAYEHLLRLVTEIRDTHNPHLDVESAATLTWSMVHGLAVLAPGLENVASKTGTRHEAVDALIERFTDHLLYGFTAR